MKRLLILVIFAFAVNIITTFEVIAEESALEIKLNIKKFPTKITRSIDFVDVEAWCDSGSNSLA